MLAGREKESLTGQRFAAGEQNGLQATVLAFQPGDGILAHADACLVQKAGVFF